jgi:hypothetical protein
MEAADIRNGSHVAFGISIRMQGIPGIAPNDVEQSFVGEGVLAN